MLFIVALPLPQRGCGTTFKYDLITMYTFIQKRKRLVAAVAGAVAVVPVTVAIAVALAIATVAVAVLAANGVVIV